MGELTVIRLFNGIGLVRDRLTRVALTSRSLRLSLLLLFGAGLGGERVWVRKAL